MSPRTRRILIVGALCIGIAAVVGIGFITWLVGTQAGLRFAVGVGLRQSPAPVTVEQIEGRIWGFVQLRGMEMEQEGTRVRLESLTLDWSPWELFARRVHVRRLELEGLQVTLAPAGRPKPSVSDSTAVPKLPAIELPLRLQLDSVRLREIVVRQVGRTDSFRVELIALDGLQYKDSLGVQRFAMATPWGELGFRGWVRTQGDYPLDLAFQWNLQPPDVPQIVGHGAISGDLDTLVVRQNVTAPAKLFAEVRLMELTKKLHFTAFAKLDPLQIANLRPGAPELTVAGQVDASGDLTRQDVSLATSVASPEYGNWDVRGALSAVAPRVELTELVVTQRGADARIAAKGHADLDSTSASLELLADWAQLAWPPVGEPLVRLPRGRLEFGGAPAAWRVAMKTEVRTPQGIEESLQATGYGDTTSFVLERLAGSLLSGRVDAQGRATWLPVIAWEATAGVNDVDISALAPGWPSRIEGRLATQGTWSDPAWTARFDVEDLGGHLRDKPLRGYLRFAGSSDSASMVDAALGYATASLTLQGSLLQPTDAAWTLTAPALGDLDPALAGRLEGAGRVQGADTLVRANASLHAAELSFGGTQVGAVDLEATLDRERGDAVDLVLLARRIAVPSLAPVDSIRVLLSGGRDGYEFRAALESEQRNAHLRGRAAVRDSVLAGQLEVLELSVAENEPWTLSQPSPFEVAPRRGSIGPLAARAGAASLRATADWVADGDIRAQASLDGFPLANLNALLPPEYQLEGTLQSTSDLTLRADGVMDADVRLEPTSGKVSWKGAKPVEIPFENLRLQLTSNAEALRLEAGLRLPGLGDLGADAGLPGFRWNHFDSTQALQGTFQAEMSEWQIVEDISSDVRDMTGRLRADVTFGGTLAVPRLAGEIRFDGGALDLPEYGLELRDVQLRAEGGSQGGWRLQSSMRSDPGTLTLQADADLSNVNLPQASVVVSGDRFKVVDTFEARVLVSPNLEMKLNGPRLDVTGTVAVPSARLDTGSRTVALAVPPSSDVRVLRDEPDTTAVPLELYARVRLTLGDDVSFKGYGVEAEPEGSIVVTQEPNKPALAQGELSLKKGTYTGYGRSLTIERGSFRYAGGPVDDPEVEIRASREIDKDDVVVGFEVSGTLKQSQLTVFSDPDMSQADAISYLLFNRPVAEAKSSESAIARETATAMGLQAGSAYTQKLASKFGLDEASLESEGRLQDASLMLGTYLTPSLYARYGIGIFDSANTFELSYFLSKHWTVEAETSSQNRAGIIYTIEP